MKLYAELAEWWPLLSPPEDYREEASIYDRVLRAALLGSAETLLELGSGGGNNASHLKARWRLTLVDIADGMLAQSRKLNPECEHVLGDMRTVKLERTFDAVFIHDAICYLTTLNDIERALSTAFAHTRPGGAVLIAPDDTRENYRPGSECGGHDGPERALRYLEWSHDPDPTDDTTVADYVYVLREADHTTRVVHDRHVFGLFARQQWIDALESAGFTNVRAELVEHSELEPGSYELFFGTRPA